MKQIFPEIIFENFAEQHKAGRYNPGLVIKLDNKVYPISAGYSDSLYFWKTKNHLYVLSVNIPLNYVGLEILDRKQKVKLVNIFIQREEDIENIFPKGLNDYEPDTIKSILLTWFT